jgi:thiamine transport system substrate-binding protein
MNLLRISIKFTSFLVFLMVFTACVRRGPLPQGVRILTYSSLGSKDGFLPAVSESFKKESGCSLEVETTLGASEMVSILSDPREADRIDAVMGVDELLFERIRDRLERSDFSDLHLSRRILPELAPSLRPGFIPLDYGALSLIYRKSAFRNPEELPRSIKDLLKDSFQRRFILQDPRSSSPGMLFFLFASNSIAIHDLRARWLTLAPGWDASYSLFLAKEAPLVWSYLSSLAYHASKGEENEYGAVVLEEGMPLQVEGIALLNHARPRSSCAGAWVDFMMKPEILERLSQKQWMLPVYSGVRLPPFFDRIPRLKKVARLDLTREKVDRLLSEFAKEVQGGSD